jgi:uncharacterized protein YndB with AHSA1/START domain
MNPLSTHAFSFDTSARPEAVWRALTDGDHGVRYLHGLNLVSDWKPGSAVEARIIDGGDDGPLLRGMVLAAQPSNRLSYVFEEGGSATYITWEIRTADGRESSVRLLVDEIDGLTDEDADNVWLPVVARFRGRIGRVL